VKRSWLTSAPPWHHFKSVCYHIRQADLLGFHAAILITGHYGPNWQDLKDLVAWLQPRVGTRLYSLPDFEANQPGFDNDGKSGGDHAGKVETSLLWALLPECVDTSRVPPENEPGPHFAMGATVRKANRKIGERMVADEVRWLGNKAKDLLAAYDHEKPEHEFRTFEAVEVFWEQVVRPKLKDMRTMQDLFPGQEPPPQDSAWHANWRVPRRALGLSET
jgi:creatinine amidohydrolase